MVPLEELENVNVMQQFKPAHLKQLAMLAKLLEYEGDDLIFAEGEPEGLIYLVLKGDVALKIKVPDSEGVQVHRVRPGELLGWSPLLGRKSMTATAHALSRCRLAAINADRLLAAMENDPRFGMEVFRCLAVALAERLHATRHHLAGSPHNHALIVGEGAD